MCFVAQRANCGRSVRRDDTVFVSDNAADIKAYTLTFGIAASGTDTVKRGSDANTCNGFSATSFCLGMQLRTTLLKDYYLRKVGQPIFNNQDLINSSNMCHGTLPLR